MHHDLLAPTSCQAQPTVAGLWFAAHGRSVWLGFACARHADELIAPRRLLPRDRDVLDRRRDRRRTELAGRRWAGEETTTMIGDRMDTDIVAGLEAGMRTVLVLTGITQATDVDHYPYRPNRIVTSIADLTDEL